MADLDEYARKLKHGLIDGNQLKSLVENNALSKQERRKISKISKKLQKIDNLTPRQLLRLQAREKKKLPRLSKDERKQKFQQLTLDDERKKEAAKFTICLGCRQRGHYVKDCPQLDIAPAEDQMYCSEVCFNCGSYEHALKNCPKARDRNGVLLYANCFICKKTGHISRDCPENSKGLYPKGGCCYVCLATNHLARDCPQKQIQNDSSQQDTDGVIFQGLSVPEGQVLGGDDIIIEESNNNDEDEEEEDKKKKMKKSSKKKRTEK